MIYTSVHYVCMYTYIGIIYRYTYTQWDITFYQTMINRYFNTTWMKGRVQPCTALGFSLLDPFCTLHSSIDKNFSCQSLLMLNLCTLLSLYLGILYPPLLSLPTQALQFKFKEMRPASVIGPSYLAVWILCPKETPLLWGKYLFCLWWSPKYLWRWDPILLFYIPFLEMPVLTGTLWQLAFTACVSKGTLFPFSTHPQNQTLQLL